MSELLIGFGIGSGWLAFGLAMLRLSGVRADRDAADHARQEQAEEFKDAHEVFQTERDRLKKQLEDLRHEVQELDKELSACAEPGDILNRLNRLLQKAGA